MIEADLRRLELGADHREPLAALFSMASFFVSRVRAELRMPGE